MEVAVRRADARQGIRRVVAVAPHEKPSLLFVSTSVAVPKSETSDDIDAPIVSKKIAPAKAYISFRRQDGQVDTADDRTGVEAHGPASTAQAARMSIIYSEDQRPDQSSFTFRLQNDTVESEWSWIRSRPFSSSPQRRPSVPQVAYLEA